MNERIKLLREQATSKMVGENNIIYDVMDVEKFAELLIKECAKEASYWWPADYYGAKRVEDRILQHFGVEE